MARITIEDCIEKVGNRFELVILASARTREIWKGAPSMVEVNNDKPAIVALREIADTPVDLEKLRHQLVVGQQRVAVRDEISDKEVREVLAEEEKRGVKDNKEFDENADNKMFQDVDLSKVEE